MKHSKSLLSEAFSITELVVVVAIIAITSSVVISVGVGELRREKVNSVAIGLSGWLEEVRRSALRGNPCNVKITTNTAGASQGAELASALPANPAVGVAVPAKACQSGNPFKIANELGSDKLKVTSTLTPAAASINFTFGALGTVSPQTPAKKEILLTLVLPNGKSDRSRCIRIIGMMGFIDIGNFTNNVCVYPSRF